MNNKQIAEKVVNRIIEEIEKNNSLPWIKPWNRSITTVKVVDGFKEVTYQPTAWNREGKPYKGANTYLPGGEYITFNQAKKEGGMVKKGAKGFPVVYWNFYDKTVTDEDGNEEKQRIPVLKYYTVFRVEDVDGIKQKHHPAPVTVKVPIEHYEPAEGNGDRNEAAEAIISEYVNHIAGNGFYIKRDDVTNRAFYSPSGDYVSAPCREQFADIAEYYSTTFHELAHSTGHSTRLNRFTGKAANAAFGSEEYSREELVAESTAASVLNALGLESANSFRNSAAYIKSWSSHIKEDPMMYITAMTRAQAAFDFLMGVEADGGNTPDGGDDEEKKPEEKKPEAVKEDKPEEKPEEVKAEEAAPAPVEKKTAGKTAYNIRVRHNGKNTIVPVPGYLFSFGGFRFGVTNVSADGKKMNAWTVSELSTGLMVNYCNPTKKAAIEATIKAVKERRAAIENALKMNGLEDANPGLIPADVIYTAA